jgi:mono/diheme cytochrome c family protein
MKKTILSLALLSAVIGVAAAPDTQKLLKELYTAYPLKSTPEAAIYRGSIVFSHYCALCHGVTADGNGRTAKLHNPRPANLIASDKNDAYKEMIIRRGGAAIGRSPYMPPWGNELTDEQISDVVAFLGSIQAKKP